MELPILLFCNENWDPTGATSLSDSLPDLVSLGYNTLCVEAPRDLSSEEIISVQKLGIERGVSLYNRIKSCLAKRNINQPLHSMDFIKLAGLIKHHFNQTRHVQIAEDIKKLPASLMLRNTLNKATKLSVSIKGIDLSTTEGYNDMTSVDLLQRPQVMLALSARRIDTMVSEITELQKNPGGIVFLCSALHANTLLPVLQKKRIQVVYCFPHNNILAMRVLAGNFENLKTHIYHLPTALQIESFRHNLINEIASHLPYIRVIQEGNILSKRLTETFKTPFKLALHPGGFVDALVRRNSSAIKAIEDWASKEDIPLRYTTANLIIQAINTPIVAKKIQESLDRGIAL